MGPPERLTITADSDSELSLSWRPPANALRPSRLVYRVQWKSGSEPYSSVRQAVLYNGTHFQDSESVSHAIRNLVNGRAYQVRVSVYGDGEAANEWAEASAIPQGDADTEAPLLRSASIHLDTLTLAYGERLDGDSLSPAGAFTVRAGTPARRVAVSGVAVDGFHVTLRLANEVAPGEAVTVDYAVPTGADAVPIRDLSGNAAPALDGVPAPHAGSVQRLVCSRTAQVGRGLLDQAGVHDCRELTPGVLSGVRHLVLHAKDIAELRPGDFSGLSNLETLDLWSNRLTSLPADIFAGLDRLRVLYLGQNRLASLPADVFSGLPRLRTLQLDGNRLETLSAGVFEGLTELSKLTLNDNAMTSLAPGVFEDLSALRTLEIGGNPGLARPVPSAAAGEDRRHTAGSAVVLDASASDGGPWGSNVVHRWRQVDDSGIAVALDDADTERAVFTFPEVPEGTVLEFELTVSGRTGFASKDRVRIGRAASSAPQVSIASNSDAVVEGAPAAFTVTRTGPASEPLTVALRVTESGAMLSGAAPDAVTFAAGAGSVELQLATEDDEAAEAASEVTAALVAGDGYALDAEAGVAVVTVEDDDAAPMVTSATSVNVAENTTEVAALAATDEDTAVENLVWSITSGADAGAFTLSAGGALAFGAAKDYEAPDDADTDGVYEVTVQVSDGANAVEAAVAVRVVDVDDVAPEVGSATVDGAVLTLAYNEALDEGSVPLASAFAVTVKNAARDVDAVAVSEGSVTLTLASPVVSDETVTVSYTVPADGAAARVRDVTGNAAVGFSAQAVTNVTPDANRSPTGKPVISGTVLAGETLTASSSEIADEDGLSDPSFAWQWIANDGTSDAEIDGATGASYTLTSAETGKTMKVRVTFTDDGGTEESLVSDATPPVALPLTASFVNLPESHDGSPFAFELRFSEEIEISYVTLRNNAFDVDGGTVTRARRLERPSNLRWEITVTPDAEEDVTITLPVGPSCSTSGAICTAEGKQLSERIATLVPVTNVTPDANTSPTGKPVISGTVLVGETLTASSSEIADEDGLSDPSFAWQWLANDGSSDAEIDGATGVSYTLTSAETGKTIRVRVTFTDDGGTEESLVSDATPPVALPLTASFVNLPESHDGSPFAFELRFSEEIEISYVTLRDTAFEVDGGTVTRARRLERPSNLRWEITVTPDTEEDVTITLPVGPSCATSGAICTAEGKRLSGRIATLVPVSEVAPLREGPTVRGVSVTSDPGADRRWGDGDRVEIEVQFSEAVTVDVSGGTPTLRFWVTGVARHASYTTGSGTSTLTFVWEVVANGTDPGRALVAADGLVLNGGTIRNEGGVDAELAFTETPAITSVGIARPVSGNRWAPGESVLVTLSFNTSVVLDTENGTPELGIRLVAGTRQAPYAGGTGTRSLRFTYPVAESDGDVRIVQVPNNALALNGGAIRNEAGEDADLSHHGTGRITAPDAIGIAVDDARAVEGEDETITFRVRFAPARNEAVSVSWTTEDGTATAGEDYAASQGTVTFAPGETEKTVEVAILDDGHDEGEETFTLRLSDASPAYLAAGGRISRATATGTIVNTDAMPKEWLARFGRAVADQVIEAVEGRFAALRSPGAEVSLAGIRVGGASAEEVEALEDREAEARLQAMSRWLAGDEDEADAVTGQSRELTARDFLAGTSFALTGGTDEAGFASVWGHGAVSNFNGRDGALSLDGEVESAILGADFTREIATAGLVVMHSRGEGSYRGQGGGALDSSLTGLYPYGRYALNERVTVWGVAGYGEGELTLTPNDAPSIETEMDLAMGTAGVRGVALEAPADGGIELSVTSDAMVVRTSFEEVESGEGGKLAGAAAAVTRLRLGLEGTWRGIATSAGGGLTPRAELGLRYDGGNAETGFGVDVGTGLVWVDPASGLSAQVSARGLLTHESDGFRDRGIAGSLAWDPRPDSNRGFSLTVSRTMGGAAAGGMDALLGRQTMEGLVASDDRDELANRRLELGLGYGFGLFGGSYTAIPEVGLGLSNGQREYRLGWRLEPERDAPVSMGLELDATLHEAANEVMLRGSVRW